MESAASETFGDPELARDWLNQINIALGMSPVAYLNQENGENEVLKILNAIEHGGAI